MVCIILLRLRIMLPIIKVYTLKTYIQGHIYNRILSTYKRLYIKASDSRRCYLTCMAIYNKTYKFKASNVFTLYNGELGSCCSTSRSAGPVLTIFDRTSLLSNDDCSLEIAIYNKYSSWNH